MLTEFGRKKIKEIEKIIILTCDNFLSGLAEVSGSDEHIKKLGWKPLLFWWANCKEFYNCD